MSYTYLWSTQTVELLSIHNCRAWSPYWFIVNFKIHKIHVDSNPFIDEVVLPSLRTLRLFNVPYMGLLAFFERPPCSMRTLSLIWILALLHFSKFYKAGHIPDTLNCLTEEFLLILTTTHPLRQNFRVKITNSELPDPSYLKLTSFGLFQPTYYSYAHSTYFIHLMTFKRGWTHDVHI